MPVYRTKPDVSLDDLIAHLEWVGEEIVVTEHVGDFDWVVVTKPPRTRNRPFTATDVTDALGQKETR